MTSNHSYPRDFFLHLLATIALYAAVVSGITLLFQYVNLLFPDALNFYRSGILDSIRWTSAVLIVVFPVYAVSMWMIHKELAQSPERGEFKIRKWLLYLTLFLAGVTIIGDIITLIYNFLSGELTVQFLFKIIIVLAVAGAVFVYYFWEARRTTFGPHPMQRAFAWGSIAAVVLAIAGGFFLTGSPFHQRQVRLDGQRVEHLSIIQSQVLDYWQRTDALPLSLNELSNPLTGFSIPADPEGKPYTYEKTGDLSFRLCAEFGAETEEGMDGRDMYYAGGPFGEAHWQHGVGQSCFDRTINPDYFRTEPVPGELKPIPAPVR